jgi:hypothetical protein
VDKSADQPARTYEYRLETYQINGSLLRTEQFNGRDYIVCPVVSMLGDTVVWSVTAPAPEFVPAQVVYIASQGWNYRPVVMNHPQVDGEYVSANSPAVLEQNCFGFVFNADYTDKDQLLVEAWLDPTSAETVGPEAVDVIARLQAGEIVEVSNGQYVIMSMQEGKTITGQEYYAVWEQVVPDHLAMLGQGSVGACSIEMGCGANRVLVQKENVIQVTQGAVRPLIVPQDNRSEVKVAASEIEDKPKENQQQRVGLFDRLMAKIRSSMSNNDLRFKLYKALSDIEPVEYVDDEDVDTKTVRYVVVVRYGDYWMDDWKPEYHYYQRTFSADAAENVTINDDRIELEYFEGWKPKAESTTAAADPTLSDAIDQSTMSDQVQDPHVSEDTHSTCACKGGTMANATANTNSARLLGDNGKPDDDKKKEGDQVPAAAPAAPEAQQPVQPAQPAIPVATTNTVEIDQEELKTLRQMAARYQQQENKKRDALVSVLKGATKFTEDRLKQMPLDDLTVLAETVGVGESAKSSRTVDYSASRFIGEGEDISTDDESSAPVMPKLSDMIKNRANGGQSKTN